VQMFKFGLTCFKARKAKTIVIVFKYWEIFLISCGYRVSGACIRNKGFRDSDIITTWNYMEQEGNKHHFNLQPAMPQYPVTTWNKRVTNTTLIYRLQCHTYYWTPPC